MHHSFHHDAFCSCCLMDSHSLLISASQPDNTQRLSKDLSVQHIVQRGRNEQQGDHLSSCCSSGARERNGRKRRGQGRCAEIFLKECPLKTAHSIARFYCCLFHRSVGFWCHLLVICIIAHNTSKKSFLSTWSYTCKITQRECFGDLGLSQDQLSWSQEMKLESLLCT